MGRMNAGGLTDAQKLDGDLGLHLCEEIWNGIGLIRLACGTFRMADSVEFAALGYDEDDNLVTVLRRESDGAFFEVDIEVCSRRVSPAAGGADGAQVPGQLSIDGVAS